MRFASLNFASGKYLVMSWSMYLVPAWMLGSVIRDIADLQLRAGGRHHLHDADGADVALRVLV